MTTPTGTYSDRRPVNIGNHFVVVDPYDSLAFSPPWKRYRVTTNERYAFPGLIRHGQFDSAVFGTSTIMST